MPIDLSNLAEPERAAIGDRICAAIHAQFPEAANAPTLHKRWPAPKPPQSVLWLLLNNPVEAIGSEDLFLSLPNILSTTSERIYGDILARKYDELNTFGLSGERKPSLKQARAVTERRGKANGNGVHAGRRDAERTVSGQSPARVTPFVRPIRHGSTPMEQAIESEILNLRRYARKLTRNGDAADDLVQNTLTRALTKQHLWQEGTDLRAWLFTILHNMHVDYVRRVVKEGISVDPNAIEITPLLFEKAAQSGRLDLRDLEDALARLPGIQRDVILFMVPNGASYNEAAKHFGIPVGTVRSRLSRGREALRRLMDRDNNERAPELDEAALKRIHLLLSGPPRSNRQISP